MPKVKILEDYKPAEGGEVGDVIEISDPSKLIAEGKVEIYVAPKKAPEKKSKKKED